MASPYDFKRDGNSVPYTTILEPAGGVAGTTGSVDRLALPANSGFVMVTTTVPVHFVFAPNDTDTADSSDPLLLPGSFYFRVPVGATHLAIAAADDDGTVSVLRMV